MAINITETAIEINQTATLINWLFLVRFGKAAMAPKKAQKKGWRAGVGGGIAAAISRTIVSPLERLRMQMITDGTRYPSNMACLRDVWAKEGVKGFWAGNGAF